MDEKNLAEELIENPAGIWVPPSIVLGEHASLGVTSYVNSGAGWQQAFDGANVDSVYFNIPLNWGYCDYDGSDLALQVRWQKNIAGSGNVYWRLRYFLSLDDGTTDADFGLDGTLDEIVDVAGMTASRLSNTQLPTMTGKADAAQLNITLQRVGTDAQDTYAGTADLFGLKLIKITE